MTEPRYDAIVVGGGAAGSFAAKELTEQGLEVLLLEAGRKVGPADFDPGLKPRRPRPINIAERVRATVAGQAVQSRAAFFSGKLKAFYVNDRDNPYTTPPDAPFVWIRGRQAGGRTHAFGRVLMRWGDEDFANFSHAGRGLDWPIRYADLAPFYDEVETCLGLYGNADGLPQIPDGRYLAPAPLSPAEARFKAEVEARWPQRHVIGWRSIAPSPERVLKPMQQALATGRLTLRHDSIVRRVLTEGKRATGVELTDRRSGVTTRVHAAHVVLCASPIETVRLMLNSASAAHPAGIGNSTDQLGRYFMDQLPMLAMGLYPGARGHAQIAHQPADPFYDPQGGIFITRADAGTDSAGRGDFDFQGSIGRMPAGSDDPARLLFFGFGQMQPEAGNRITLARRKRDRWGIPAPHVTCRMSAADLALLARQEAFFRETIEGVGGQLTFLGSPAGVQEWGPGAYPEADPLSRFLFRRMFPRIMVMGAAIHECGGARMGEDPARSVVDPLGRCWDVPNLWLTDAATFCGSGVTGTTLTVMAQTLRSCRSLAATLRAAEAPRPAALTG